MSERQHFYFTPVCFFCGKNNKRRNTRKGQSWKCHHCGEVNPGPGMLKSLLRAVGNGHPESREPEKPKPAVKPAVTTIATIEETAVVATAKPKKKPAAVAPAVAKKPSPAAPKAQPPSPPKGRGFFDGLAERVYG